MKKFNLVLLSGFILLAVVLNFIPHLNYSYPLHVDEWVHFQYAKHLSPNSPLYFRGESESLEEGFHYLLASLNVLGVPYLFMFSFFSSLITILICIGVFIYTRRIFGEVAGIFSVLFIALLKSSVMILGPMFFVPMAIGMFFIVIGLFLIKLNSKLMVLILASILIIHPPTAMAFLLLINLEFIILTIRKKQKYLENIFLQLIAGLIALPFYLDIFLSKGFGTINYLSFSAISSSLFIPRYLGWFSIFIILIGIYFIAEKKNYSIPVYILFLLGFIFMFYHYKIELFIPYRRALMYLFLILAIPFGYGCKKLINLSNNNKMKIIIALFLIFLILFFSLPSKLESTRKVYHIIDDEDYEAFNYIKENTPKNSVFILDPWKANAFTPIAERGVYSRIVQGPDEIYSARNKEIYEFFNSQCNNISFLKNNEIDFVYGNCNNSNLKEVYPKVWKFNPFL